MSGQRGYYLTRYALNGGIQKLSGRLSAAPGGQWIKLSGYYDSFLPGRDVFETRAEAEADAEKRRLKKIASLQKQVAKFEAMTIKAP